MAIEQFDRLAPGMLTELNSVSRELAGLTKLVSRILNVSEKEVRNKWGGNVEALIQMVGMKGLGIGDRTEVNAGIFRGARSGGFNPIDFQGNTLGYAAGPSAMGLAVARQSAESYGNYATNASGGENFGVTHGVNTVAQGQIAERVMHQNRANMRVRQTGIVEAGSSNIQGDAVRRESTEKAMEEFVQTLKKQGASSSILKEQQDFVKAIKKVNKTINDEIQKGSGREIINTEIDLAIAGITKEFGHNVGRKALGYSQGRGIAESLDVVDADSMKANNKQIADSLSAVASMSEVLGKDLPLEAYQELADALKTGSLTSKDGAQRMRNIMDVIKVNSNISGKNVATVTEEMVKINTLLDGRGMGGFDMQNSILASSVQRAAYGQQEAARRGDAGVVTADQVAAETISQDQRAEEAIAPSIEALRVLRDKDIQMSAEQRSSMETALRVMKDPHASVEARESANAELMQIGSKVQGFRVSPEHIALANKLHGEEVATLKGSRVQADRKAAMTQRINEVNSASKDWSDSDEATKQKFADTVTNVVELGGTQGGAKDLVDASEALNSDKGKKLLELWKKKRTTEGLTDEEKIALENLQASLDPKEKKAFNTLDQMDASTQGANTQDIMSNLADLQALSDSDRKLVRTNLKEISNQKEFAQEGVLVRTRDSQSLSAQARRRSEESSKTAGNLDGKSMLETLSAGALKTEDMTRETASAIALNLQQRDGVFNTGVAAANGYVSLGDMDNTTKDLLNGEGGKVYDRMAEKMDELGISREEFIDRTKNDPNGIYRLLEEKGGLISKSISGEAFIVSKDLADANHKNIQSHGESLEAFAAIGGADILKNQGKSEAELVENEDGALGLIDAEGNHKTLSELGLENSKALVERIRKGRSNNGKGEEYLTEDEKKRIEHIRELALSGNAEARALYDPLEKARESDTLHSSLSDRERTEADTDIEAQMADRSDGNTWRDRVKSDEFGLKDIGDMSGKSFSQAIEDITATYGSEGALDRITGGKTYKELQEEHDGVIQEGAFKGIKLDEDSAPIIEQLEKQAKASKDKKAKANGEDPVPDLMMRLLGLMESVVNGGSTMKVKSV